MPAELSDRTCILATDLDGTFLGGSKADRRRLYEWIEDNRSGVGLIFVSGRDPEFIHELCNSGVPWPDYVIGDVGTTIAQVTEDRRIEPIKALEEDISRRWNDSGNTVRSLLNNHPGLRLQPTAFRYRVSYDYDPDSFDASATDKIRALGLDVLISDNRFFDVLPGGVSKGPSLLRLLEHLDIPQTRVLAAGDTLNDHSMLIAGTPAVAVGGSEQPLLDQLPHVDRIHRARAIGAAGILEAISHFDLHPLPQEVLHAV